MLHLSQVVKAEPGWYSGDFHAHTNFSDGFHSPAGLLQVARKEALDFLAITDHNTIASFPHFGDHPGMVIIPGMEATIKEGHFNIFGIEQETEWLHYLAKKRNKPATKKKHSINQIIEDTHREGLLNSINHPLLPPWDWLDKETQLQYIHCLEIWNDPSWPGNEWANPAAIQLWTALLNAGYRITAIGGSDYHRPEPDPGQQKPAERIGYPRTHVYASELSGRAILDGLRQQKAYVSLGPLLTFQAKTNGRIYQIGDDIGEQLGEVTFVATIAGIDAPGTAQVLKNGRVLATQPLALEGKTTLQVKDRLLPGEMTWYRLDIVGVDGQILAVTNPIFSGRRRQPQEQVYGDFVNDRSAYRQTR